MVESGKGQKRIEFFETPGSRHAIRGVNFEYRSTEFMESMTAGNLNRGFLWLSEIEH
jgi:hypothetical protein